MAAEPGSAAVAVSVAASTIGVVAFLPIAHEIGYLLVGPLFGSILVLAQFPARGWRKSLVSVAVSVLAAVIVTPFIAAAADRWAGNSLYIFMSPQAMLIAIATGLSMLPLMPWGKINIVGGIVASFRGGK